MGLKTNKHNYRGHHPAGFATIFIHFVSAGSRRFREQPRDTLGALRLLGQSKEGGRRDSQHEESIFFMAEIAKNSP